MGKVDALDAGADDYVTKPFGIEEDEMHLTPIEWRLLEALAREPNRLVTQRQLLQEVWGPGFETETNDLRLHFTHRRPKLEPDPRRPRYIRTEPGVGYRFPVPATG